LGRSDQGTEYLEACSLLEILETRSRSSSGVTGSAVVGAVLFVVVGAESGDRGRCARELSPPERAADGEGGLAETRTRERGLHRDCKRAAESEAVRAGERLRAVWCVSVGERGSV
jgi:hypothetical protein